LNRILEVFSSGERESAEREGEPSIQLV
jgi:hypothetical protein